MVACAAGADTACEALLRRLPTGSLPGPLGAQARTTLVRVAMAMGGRDAYRRLVADPRAPMADRIASAANATLDDVMARWRQAILLSRPPSVALPWWAVSLALGWAAAFGVCALRSSRWRLG